MIDLSTYRFRIGSFNAARRGERGKGWGMGINGASHSVMYKIQSHRSSSLPYSFITESCPVARVCSGFIYLYTILTFLTLSAIGLILIDSRDVASAPPNFSWCSSGLTTGLSLQVVPLIKAAYLYIISIAILKAVTVKRIRLKFYSKVNGRASRALRFLLLAILTLNFLLIGVCNPSMLNPGPRNLNVCYQNVEGLISFSHLGDAHPKLNVTKIYELNTFISEKKPDILLLNETWLKKSIKDHEVIQSSNYTVFRSDRSQLTHPPDPSNPKKFRKYGGGVLIAVRSDIADASVKRISMRKGAEIVSVELTVGQEKLIFSTIYRVGTLGEVIIAAL